MKMQNVLEFLLAIPKKDRPENLISIITTLANKFPENDVDFVAGSDGKLYAAYADCFVEIQEVYNNNDSPYRKFDVEVAFEQFVRLLDGFTIKKFGAKTFNIWTQQLLELNEEKALPIVEKKLKELCGNNWTLKCLAYNASDYDNWAVKYFATRANTTFQMFLVPAAGNVVGNPPELELKIFTSFVPAFVRDGQFIYQTVRPPFRLQCAEFLLNLLIEE